MKNSGIPALLKKLNAIPGCRAVKTHGSGYGKRGDPDVRGVVCGLAFFFEVKQQGEGATPIQAVELRRWRAVGATCAVITTREEAIALVEQLRARAIALGLDQPSTEGDPS